MTREEMLAQVKRKRMIAEVQAKRAAAQPVSDSMFEENNIVQEQHPEIGTVDRLLIKNLAISPEVGVKYLQEKYPGMDVRVHKGEIIARRPNEKSFRVLDPDTGFFSKDFIADVGDIAADVGVGAAQSAATALGAAGGLPGAMAASGASGAGLEALKQKLGYALGLPQPELDKGQVAMAGGVGAALPAVGKGLGKAGTFLKDKFLPGVGRMSSGVPSSVLKDSTENAPRVKFYSENPDELSNVVKDTAKDIKEGGLETLNRTGAAIRNVLEEQEAKGKFVDISGLKQALDKKIAQAEKEAAGEMFSPESMRPLENLKSLKDAYFTSSATGEELPNLVPPTVAFNLKQRIKNITNLSNDPRAISKIKDPAAAEIQKAGGELYGEITKAINPLDERLPALNHNFATQAEAVGNITKRLTTEEKADNFFRNIDATRNKTVMRQLERVLPKDRFDQVRDKLQILQTQSYMGDPSSNALSGLGSTSTSRTIPLATAGAGMGAYLGYKIGNSPGTALLGSALGAKTGGFLGSPKAVGLGLRGVNAVSKAVDKIPGKQPAAYGAAQSAWDEIKKRIERGE